MTNATKKVSLQCCYGSNLSCSSIPPASTDVTSFSNAQPQMININGLLLPDGKDQVLGRVGGCAISSPSASVPPPPPALFALEAAGSNEQLKQRHHSPCLGALEADERSCYVPDHSTRQDEKGGSFSSNGKPSVYFWLALAASAYALLILCFIGVLYAVVKVSRNTFVVEDDFLDSPAEGRPVRTQRATAFAPLPLLWALPLEFFQEVPSILLQLSDSEKELAAVKAVYRDSKRNITRCALSTNFQLTVTPDIGVLESAERELVMRWNFNTVWREIYEQEYGAATDNNGLREKKKKNEEGAEEEFDRIWAAMRTTVESVAANSGSSSGSSLLPAYVTETGGGASAVSDPSLSGNGITQLDERIGGDRHSVQTSFPLLRRSDADTLPSSASEGHRTPPSAMSLPASVVSESEFAKDGELVLSGFPVPMVNENEPLVFSGPSASARTLSKKQQDEKDFLDFKVKTIFEGTLLQTANKVNTLAAMGGVFVTPAAVPLETSNPTSRITAPMLDFSRLPSPQKFYELPELRRWRPSHD